MTSSGCCFVFLGKRTKNGNVTRSNGIWTMAKDNSSHCQDDSFLRAQPRHLSESLLQIVIQLSIDRIELLVLPHELPVRRDFVRLLDCRAARFFDGFPDTRADSGEKGNAIRGAFGGV